VVRQGEPGLIGLPFFLIRRRVETSPPFSMDPYGAILDCASRIFSYLFFSFRFCMEPVLITGDSDSLFSPGVVAELMSSSFVEPPAKDLQTPPIRPISPHSAFLPPRS